MSEDEDLLVENLEDDDLETFERDEAEEANEVQAENEDDTAEEDKKPVKPKRVIRNPQPKLNAETLKGKRGLAALESYFDRVKFKGRGSEEQDLTVILKTYEYWCHRLFPKYPFDECISKIESLGTKKPVLTHIKRIRLDMLFDDQPIIDNDHDSESDEIPFDQFNDLLPTASLQPPTDISEEQFERIRINKERAERIRREKLQQTMEIDSSSQENHEPHNLHTTLNNDTSLHEDIASQMESLGSRVDIEAPCSSGSQELTHTTLNNDTSLHEELTSQMESLESQVEICDNIEESIEAPCSSGSQELTTQDEIIAHAVDMPVHGVQPPSTADIHD